MLGAVVGQYFELGCGELQDVAPRAHDVKVATLAGDIRSWVLSQDDTASQATLEGAARAVI